MSELELFVIETRLNKDDYKNQDDKQKDIDNIISIKQKCINQLRKDLYDQELDKYRFLHKYKNYDMVNDICYKKEFLVNDDWGFKYSEQEDIDLMVETRHNSFWYSLFHKISGLLMYNGIGSGLGDYEDIRDRTIIDNLLKLNQDLKTIEKNLSGL
jgi:hypothetical protein